MQSDQLQPKQVQGVSRRTALQGFGGAARALPCATRWDRSLLDHAYNWERGAGQQPTYAYLATRKPLPNQYSMGSMRPERRDSTAASAIAWAFRPSSRDGVGAVPSSSEDTKAASAAAYVGCTRSNQPG